MNSKRICMPRQNPQERIKNFKEIDLGYDQNQAISEASRCLGCEESSCQLYCPFNLNIPDFIANIKIGDFEEAYKLLTDKIFHPSITCRVCPSEALCENGCKLGIKEGNDPIAVAHLERFISDWAFEKKIFPLNEKEDIGKSVAIIGTGPSGMTVAANLRRKGYHVNIYEALEVAGGVLTYLIPEFRIPKKIIKNEMIRLEKSGVKIIYKHPIGIMHPLEDIENEYDAVFIGIGLFSQSNLGIKGESLKRVYKASDFLFQVNLSELNLMPKSNIQINIGDKVVVVGTGNLALDSARTAVRLGARVEIFCKGLIESLQIRHLDIQNSIEEGIKYRQLMHPTKLIGRNGKIVEFEYSINKLVKEYYNSDKIVSIKTQLLGSYSCNHFIYASERKPNPLFSKNSPQLFINNEGFIKINPRNLLAKTSDNSLIFAGGDIIGKQIDARRIPVIDAIEFGKLAAKNIDYHLNRIPSENEPLFFYY